MLSLNLLDDTQYLTPSYLNTLYVKSKLVRLDCRLYYCWYLNTLYVKSKQSLTVDSIISYIKFKYIIC